MKLLTRLVVNALALGVAVWLFDGITLTGGSDTDKLVKLLIVGAIFGLVNSVVRPIVSFFSLPRHWELTKYIQQSRPAGHGG